VSNDDLTLDPDDLNIPDVPQTALAFRTWRLSESGRLLSINAPSLTGKAGGNPNVPQRRVTWIHRALADPEGQDGWPIGGPLVAHCGVGGDAAEKNPDHGKIPSQTCSCGIYATTELKIIDHYLGNELVQGLYIRGPVLGVVELGGRVIPATQGFRAAYARVAAILLIDEVFSLSAGQLRHIAETYRVPAIKPHSTNPEDYRDDLTPATPVADEADEWLRNLEQGGDEEDE
jgi:hypothetical protein